jgi:hypothetical protein
VPLGDYLAGLGFFVVIWGAAACAAVVLARRHLPRLDVAPRALAVSLLFLVALLGAHLVPGALGVLSPPAVAVTAVLGALLAWRMPRGAAASVRSQTPAPRREGGRLPSALAVAATAAVGALAIGMLLGLRAQPPSHVDAMTFALPGVAEWLRSGSLWESGAFVPLLQIRTYPNNGELLALATILPWDNDAFLRLLGPALVGLIGLGVYAAGRELRAPAATAGLVAAAAVAAHVVAGAALSELKPDAFMYATFAAGIVFLLRHARTGAPTDLVLAGLGLGLAFGSRWYGLPAVAVVLGAWWCWRLINRWPLKVVVRDALALTGVVLVAGGFWLLRNLALTGNPLYPVRLHPFGLTLLDAPRDVLTEDFSPSVADRLGQPGFIRQQLAPAARGAFSTAGALLLAGTALALVIAARRGRAAVGSRLWPLLVGAAALALVYLMLPAGAQGLPRAPVPGIVEANMRWLVPAFLLGACCSAWALARVRRGWTAVHVVAFICVLAALPAAYSVSGAALAVGGVVVAIAWLLGPRLADAALQRFRAGRRGVLAGAAVLACAVFAVVGHLHQRGYNEVRFADRSAVVAWVEHHAPAGARVGVAGHWSATAFVPIYALFGPRLENDVEYVGPVVSDQVLVYEDRERFRAALRNRDLDLLAVGRLSAPDLERLTPQRSLDEPPEARWARSAGFVEVARDPAFILLARPGVRARVGGRERFPTGGRRTERRPTSASPPRL